jgi:hypothetical protein
MVSSGVIHMCFEVPLCYSSSRERIEKYVLTLPACASTVDIMSAATHLQATQLHVHVYDPRTRIDLSQTRIS